jgi:hypothetical protein
VIAFDLGLGPDHRVGLSHGHTLDWQSSLLHPFVPPLDSESSGKHVLGPTRGTIGRLLDWQSCSGHAMPDSLDWQSSDRPGAAS